jgi:glucosylceramidase
MKENTTGHNGYSGGTLKSTYFSLYADYFIKYIDAMAAWNIPIWGISVQNEPLNGHNNPSMTWTKESMYKFIAGNLGQKLQDSQYSAVRIIAYDHNCDVTDFPIHVAKSKYVYGTAFHLYAGSISALSTVYETTGKPVLFTEQYTGAGGDFSGDLGWHMQNVVLGSLNNMSTTALEWNLCSDPDYSIHTSGGCTTCLGALTVNGSALSSRNVSYYIVGHASRVIDPGAVRIGVGSSVGNIVCTAAANPDGSIGVVAYNDANQSRVIAVDVPDAGEQTLYANHTLPAKAVLSVRIRPTVNTAVETTATISGGSKHIQNGQLIIEHNGHCYDVLGQKL